MMKAKRIKPVDGGDFFLPEVIIQDIQSFLSHKEAARTAILSKSWYNAWLTRPLLHFDQSDFQNGEKKLLKITHKFVYFTAKTLQRYKDSNMKIERFILRMSNNINDMYLAKALILDAVKLGATDLNIELHKASLVVPQELIRSETLVRLHLREFHLGEKFRCWRLNSLSLDRVSIKNGDVMRDMLSCCIWIEELSFSKCTMMNFDSDSFSTLRMSGLSLHELHKLRRLFLEEVEVDSLFFSDLSRFHCLKELILVRCRGCTTIEIASTSLQHIKFVTKKAVKVKLDVPNIHIFSYSGKGLPKSLCIKADASREWESYISLTSLTPQKSCWFQRLRRVLDKLRASKINLYLNLCGRIVDEEGSSVALPQPAVLQTLTIEAPDSIFMPLMHSFRVCRPKFIIHSWVAASRAKNKPSSLDSLCQVLMHQAMRPNCFVPNLDIVGRFGLMEVKVEVYEDIPSEWRHQNGLANKEKIRFRLRWGRRSAYIGRMKQI